MHKFVHFFIYNNIVPITITFVLLGAASTYAATNPDVVIKKEQHVVSIDNSYIANLDFKRFTPSVKITSVTEDTDAYYIQYDFSTVSLVDAVWKDITTSETMTVQKSSLGNYRDLGLFVTQQLKEKIQAELKLLKETQVIEKKQLSQKKVVTKYKGLVGGFLDDSVETIKGYQPVVKPPKPEKETETFARPDPNAKPLPMVIPKDVPVEEVPQPIEDVVGTTTDSVPTITSTATSTATTSDGGGGSGSDVIPNDAPTLTILGDNPVELFVGDTYTDLGAAVTDDHDTSLTIQVYLNGNAVDHVLLDTSTSTKYTITYESVDSNGAIAQEQRIVTVKAKVTVPPPTPPATTTPTTTPPQQSTPTPTPTTTPSVPVIVSIPLVASSSATTS